MDDDRNVLPGDRRESGSGDDAIAAKRASPPAGWAPSRPAGTVILDLAAADGDTCGNLSAATLVDDTLFVAADEALFVERLVRQPDGTFASHVRFSLVALLPLDDPDGEVDIEGMAVEDDWLWVLGSHARTRNKPSGERDDTIDLADLADLKDTRARCLIARLPLARDTADPGRLTPSSNDGARRAGMMKQTKRGNKLSAILARDPLIGPFTRLPAKEGGLDIEGIAVSGDRVALGLRGPTLGGNAVLIELTVTARRSGRLKLELPPFFRLLDLEGLAIRDLKLDGDDLLILAGPTTAVSGPCALFRWPGWLHDLPAARDKVRLHRPVHVMDLPHGRGFDHPEGLALMRAGVPGRLLLFNDSPAPKRLRGKRLHVDRFDLPD